MGLIYFLEKNFAALTALLGAIIGGLIVVFSNWWLNKLKEESERKEKVRANLQTVIYHAKRLKANEQLTDTDKCELQSSADRLSLLLYHTINLKEKTLYALIEEIINKSKQANYPKWENLIDKATKAAHIFLKG